MGVVPLGALTLLEFGLIKKQEDEEGKLRFHATMVAIFLIVAHIAMIFGMLNPSVLGWSESQGVPVMQEMVMTH